MNKSELITAIANHANLTKADAGRALDGFITAIESNLRNDLTVTMIGFGSFEVKQRSERIGRNPQTGAEIKIAATKIPSFKAGKVLKDVINT